MMEKAAAFKQGHVLFTGINQLGVFFARLRLAPHPQQAIFTVQKHFFVGRQIVGDARR